MYDVVIIGKGPAGVSASLYAKRANMSTLVIGKDEGALLKSEKIDNYYGFEDGISGKDLIETGIKQAENLGVEVVTDEVLGISWDNIFKITTKKNEYESKALIIATGSSRVKPKIKGIKEFEGKGVSYCAVCDGFFYRGRDVAILGNGDFAVHEAMQLLPVVKSVTMLTNGTEPLEHRAEGLKVNSKEIREVRGETEVSEVEFSDNTKMPISGIFVAEGTASSVDFARTIRNINRK